VISACAVVCAALATLTAWFSPVAAADRDEAEALKARAERFWQARVQDDWATVYELLPLEDLEKAPNRDRYVTFMKTKGPLLYLSATVGEVAIDGDLGWVEVEYSVRPRPYPIKPDVLKVWDLWEKRDDWRPVTRTRRQEFPTRPPQARPADEEAALVRRADAMWTAITADNWPEVYEMHDAKYREAMPKENFLKRRSKYRNLSHRIEWAEVAGRYARVKVSYTRILDDPALTKLEPEQKVVLEDWIKENDQWFRFMSVKSRSH
jgi:hypothetical protein